MDRQCPFIFVLRYSEAFKEVTSAFIQNDFSEILVTERERQRERANKLAPTGSCPTWQQRPEPGQGKARARSSIRVLCVDAHSLMRLSHVRSQGLGWEVTSPELGLAGAAGGSLPQCAIALASGNFLWSRVIGRLVDMDIDVNIDVLMQVLIQLFTHVGYNFSINFWKEQLIKQFVYCSGYVAKPSL